MIGTKELCALLLGTSLGVGGTVAVKHKVSPKPPATAKAKGERVRTASRPRVVRPEPARPAPHILDCPITGSPFAAVPVPGLTVPAPLPPLGAVVWSPFLQTGGAAIAPNQPAPPTSPPAVPEPDAWLVWIAGFGLVGLSLRTRKAAA